VHAELLSRLQTIFCGRGLVSKDNRPMKCTTSKLLTCRVTNGGLIWSAFYVVSPSKIKQHIKASTTRRPCRLPFLSSLSWRDKWHVSWFNDFIGRLTLETKPRPKSWQTLSIVWCRLYRLPWMHVVYSLFPSYYCMDSRQFTYDLAITIIATYFILYFWRVF